MSDFVISSKNNKTLQEARPLSVQTLTCPWNIFVNESRRMSSLPSPSFHPHLDKCHGLPNRPLAMGDFFFPLFLPFNTVILLPWRLEINSIMRYRPLHSQWEGFGPCWRHQGRWLREGWWRRRRRTTSHLSCDWLPPVNKVPLRFFFYPPSLTSPLLLLLVRAGGVSVAERSARLSDKKPHQAPWWCSDGTKFPKRAAHRRASQLVPLSVRLNAPLPPFPHPPTTPPPSEEDYIYRKQIIRLESREKSARPVRFHNQPDWQQLWIHVCVSPADIPVSIDIFFFYYYYFLFKYREPALKRL